MRSERTFKIKQDMSERKTLVLHQWTLEKKRRMLETMPQVITRKNNLKLKAIQQKIKHLTQNTDELNRF